MTAKVLVGDCREVLLTLEANSIDACVTDPPYGLEFMGKEWDKLDAGLPQENVWKGRRGNGGSSVGSDDTKPSSRHHVSYGNSTRAQFKRCTVCGKRQFSGSPCQCDAPEWVIEHPEGAPSSSIRMQRWHETWAREVYRVLKPGAHLLAFSGTRTSHRMVCAIEDAGFEIRDCLMWLYGSGFPKSLDVSKAMDKAAGVEREVVGQRNNKGRVRAEGWGMSDGEYDPITAPATDLARQWDGWGTALKPSYEPIILARKPLSGTVAANVTQYGTGALNIDATRIGSTEINPSIARRQGAINHLSDRPAKETEAEGRMASRQSPEAFRAERFGEYLGRWPANLVLDEDAARLLDAMSGERTSGTGAIRKTMPGLFGLGGDGQANIEYGDTGGASRFFYTSKSSRAERNKGLAGMPEQVAHRYSEKGQGPLPQQTPSNGVRESNHHPRSSRSTSCNGCAD
jgi:hypothetical protein